MTRALGSLLSIFFAGCATVGKPRLQPVSHLDLDRYMGPWRVIAVMDNSVERRFADAVETYSRRSGDEIDVHFRWRDQTLQGPVKTHDFTGRVVDPKTEAVWKMNLFPVLRARYVVLAVDPHYRWAAVGHPSRRFGWVLARDAQLDEAKYQDLMQVFVQQGYETKRFIRVPQPSRR